jgi:hypothetical protein
MCDVTEPAADSEAKNPGTTAGRLSELAAANPGLLADIARHPNVYPDLLQWIAGNGDAEARGVAARLLIVSPPPPPAPGAPRVADGPVPPPPSSSEAPVAAPRRRRRGLVIGLAIAVVVVLAAVAASLIIPRLLNGDDIRVAELEDVPEAGAWSLAAPAGLASDTGATVRGGFTTAQDRAVVLWRFPEPDGAESTWISLVDTSAGDEVWSTKLEMPVADVSRVGDPRGADVAILRVTAADGSTTLVGVDLATGAYESVSGLESLAAPASLQGDVVVRDPATNSIQRYIFSTMSSTWTVPVEGDTPPLVAGSSLLMGTRAFDLADGSDRGWSPDPATVYGDAGGRLLAQQPTGDQTSLIGVIDESSGAFDWSIDVAADTRLLAIAGTDLFAASSATFDETIVVDGNDGRILWTAAALAPDTRSLVGSKTANLVVMPVGGDGTIATVFDSEAGTALYDLTLSTAGVWQSMIGATPKTIYLAGGEAAQLQALEARDGGVRWTLDNPAPPHYAFVVWGGNVVAFRSTAYEAEGGPLPSLLGVQ